MSNPGSSKIADKLPSHVCYKGVLNEDAPYRFARPADPFNPNGVQRRSVAHDSGDGQGRYSNENVGR
jgi:hypothetical protein